MSDAHRSALREAAIVARYEIASMVTSLRAILFLVVYGVIAGAAGGLFLRFDRETGGNLMALGSSLGPAEREGVIQQLKSGGLPVALVEAVLEGSLPILVVFVLFTSTFVLPGLVLLVGYTGLADDLHSRFARYALQRVRRGSWLAGKMLAHFAVTLGAVLLVHLALLALGSRTPNLELAQVASTLPRIWLSMAVFLLGYVAYTAMFAVAVRPPFAAFALGCVVLAGLWVLSFGPLDEVWMGSLDLDLWGLRPEAIAIYVGHAAAFSALAWFALKRRDV